MLKFGTLSAIFEPFSNSYKPHNKIRYFLNFWTLQTYTPHIKKQGWNLKRVSVYVPTDKIEWLPKTAVDGKLHDEVEGATMIRACSKQSNHIRMVHLEQ